VEAFELVQSTTNQPVSPGHFFTTKELMVSAGSGEKKKQGLILSNIKSN
jgi:hypothetical protein